MNSSALPISYFDLLLSAAFVSVAGLLSCVLSLGLGRSLLMGSIRTYLQLIALGVVLTWVFRNQSALVVWGLFLLMTVSASRILLGRVRSGPGSLFGPSLVSMLLSGLTVTLAVTQLIIHVRPWYQAQYILPIAGMILGNSMTGVALTLERLFGDLTQRAEEVWMLLALGATPWEASRTSIRAALGAGLIPTINAMNAVGIVSIPGMMTGQILAGADPSMAARYQIVVMLMLSASTAIGAIVSVLLAYPKVFDTQWRFLPPSSLHR
ncbi:MAG: iron export ABC transporter permease subunit FetB [Armatimonadetes bacterium]|nr:iron export ABC transporter permease subunit FetB [Armatimonadota bacterium]